MVYSFRINKYIDQHSGIGKSNPLLEINDQEKYGWHFIDEINNLSSNLGYVKEIVSYLDALLKGEIDFYEGFGYEVYMIECDKESAKVKNVFEDDKIEAVIPTQDIYKLMRDWRDYLIEWESQNNVK